MAAPGSSAEAQPSGGPAHAAVVFVGHHQAGKSTIAGHIIMKLGGLDKRLLDRVERDTSNRPASRYAWVRLVGGEQGLLPSAVGALLALPRGLHGSGASARLRRTQEGWEGA